MDKTVLKRIPIKFTSMTQDEKDDILKTLLVLVFKTTPEEFPILKTYARYGNQAFDDLVEVFEDEHTYYFKRKKV